MKEYNTDTYDFIQGIPLIFKTEDDSIEEIVKTTKKVIMYKKCGIANHKATITDSNGNPIPVGMYNGTEQVKDMLTLIKYTFPKRDSDEEELLRSIVISLESRPIETFDNSETAFNQWVNFYEKYHKTKVNKELRQNELSLLKRCCERKKEKSKSHTKNYTRV